MAKKQTYKLTQPNHFHKGERVEVGDTIELTEQQAAGLVNKVELVEAPKKEKAPDFNPETDTPETAPQYKAVLDHMDIKYGPKDNKDTLIALYEKATEV